MMGPRQEAQPALFYEFSLEDHVPQNHLLRSIDRLSTCQGSAATSPIFTAIQGGRRSTLNSSLGCCWWAIASASGRSGGSARRSI